MMGIADPPCQPSKTKNETSILYNCKMRAFCATLDTLHPPNQDHIKSCD